MKTFRKTYLPEEITYNGKTYKRLISESARLTLGEKVDTTNCVKVLVLPRTLKGRTDLHGKEYQPTEWLFKSTEPALYKVFKVGRKSCRRSIIEKNLTEAEAQRVVKRFPISSRSMICYTRQ